MLNNSKNVTTCPGFAAQSDVDALTDILKTVHLIGSLYCRSELGAPWGMLVPKSNAAQFHVIRQGRCYLNMPDGESESIYLQSGDLVVLTHGPRHELADAAATPTLPIDDILKSVNQIEASCHTQFSYGGEGAITELICGYFEFETGHIHPLLSVLPPIILIRGEGGRAMPWLEVILDLLVNEISIRKPGAETVINRLTETMLIQALRVYLSSENQAEASWLSGLSDPQIGASLGIIHRQPNSNWTIETLAAAVGMSRSGFAERFKTLTGEPPMQYLTRWRMELAAVHLRQGHLSLSQIAEKVGYQAEPAFSRVFKKLWGTSPGAYRRNTISVV